MPVCASWTGTPAHVSAITRDATETSRDVLVFITRRLFFAFLLLIAVSIFTYLIFALLPSDPAALTCGKNCKP
ncbi:MAG: hypothetical protein ACKOA6_12450, partial [Actinomycetota bacterium]